MDATEPLEDGQLRQNDVDMTGLLRKTLSMAVLLYRCCTCMAGLFCFLLCWWSWAAHALGGSAFTGPGAHPRAVHFRAYGGDGNSAASLPGRQLVRCHLVGPS